MSQTNKEIVWNYLQSKGLSKEASAGVMGNIEKESGFSTTAENGSSGAYGLFQWTGDRKTRLQQYAKSKGKSVSDINLQLDYFWNELNSSESATKTVLLSSDYSTASEYAEAFEKSYERSGGSLLEERQESSEKILSEMTGTHYTDTSTIIQDKVYPNYGLKWWGDIVKVVLVILLLILGVVFFAMTFKFENPISTVKKTAIKALEEVS